MIQQVLRDKFCQEPISTDESNEADIAFIVRTYLIPEDIAKRALQIFHGPGMTVFQLETIRRSNPELVSFDRYIEGVVLMMPAIERASSYLASHGNALSASRTIDLVLKYGEHIYDKDFSILRAVFDLERQESQHPAAYTDLHRATHGHKYPDAHRRDEPLMPIDMEDEVAIPNCPRDDQPCRGPGCGRRERPFACLPTLDDTLGNYLGTGTFVPQSEFDSIGHNNDENYVRTKAEND